MSIRKHTRKPNQPTDRKTAASPPSNAREPSTANGKPNGKDHSPHIEELRQCAQWVLWEWQEKPDPKTGKTKRTKVPVDTRGHNHDVHDPKIWMQYEEAKKQALRLNAKSARKFDIGFVLTAKDAWCGIDLDHCINPITKREDDWAKKVVDQFCSYTEYTPSGEGLRIWVRGVWKSTDHNFPIANPRHPEARIEVYCERRYFTVTENSYYDLPIRKAQAKLDELADDLATKPEPRAAKRVSSGASTARLPRLDLGEWLERHHVPVKLKKQRGDGQVVYAIPCGGTHEGYPLDDGKAYVGQTADGGLFARCLHASCSWYSGRQENHWAEFRAIHEPEYAEQRVAQEWEAALQRSDKGVPLSSVDNFVTILSQHERWQEVLAFNEFSNDIEVKAKKDEEISEGGIEDHTYSHIQAWMERNYWIRVSWQNLTRAVELVARQSATHPVREYLDSLSWDGTKRLETFFQTYYACKDDGKDDKTYLAAIGRMFLISAVARVSEPGVKVDHVLVLQGAQGIYKSQSLKILFSEAWFTDQLPPLDDKDASLQLRGVWCLEISEFDRFSRSQLTQVKSFITRTDEHYRPPYGMRTVRVPRQNVFVVTVNPKEFLTDEENRRYWTVGAEHIDVAALARDRDQLWAEAAHRYQQGEKWWPAPELQKLLKKAEEEHEVENPLVTTIGAWIGAALRGRQLTTALILEDCLQIPKAQWHSTTQRVAAAMKKLNYERRRVGRGATPFWAKTPLEAPKPETKPLRKFDKGYV